MTIISRLKKVPFIAVLAIASLISIAEQASGFAGTGASAIKTLWSSVSSVNTLWSGTSSVFTLSSDGTVPATTAISATLVPIIYGAVVLIMLLMGITLAITHSIKSVILVLIAGLIGIFGIIMLQDVVLHLFGQ